MALTGVEIPVFKEPGLTEVSPARATIDSVRIDAAEYRYAEAATIKKDAKGVCVALKINGFPRPVADFAAT
ncbi:hypothetical protein GHL52_21890 [Salmonella enterica]|nr:hypothetical protein [Salmonella enterica]